MRFKLGRPSLADIPVPFDVPEARGGVGVTFAGVSTLYFDDGESAALIDGFFSRPPLRRVGLGRIDLHAPHIDRSLLRLGLLGSPPRLRLDVLTPVHSHYDHAMDVGFVTRRTTATLAGGTSTANIGRGAGVDESRIRVVTPGEPTRFGAWELTWIVSDHCPPDRFPGTIDEPVTLPAKASRYRCGEAWSIIVRHDGGRSALVQGSAGFVPDSLRGHSVDVAYLGVGQLGLQPESYIEDYWRHTVREVGARSVVLTHWDDFFRDALQPLRALPYAVDDLDVSTRVLSELARADGVRLAMPTAWRREDPWALA